MKKKMVSIINKRSEISIILCFWRKNMDCEEIKMKIRINKNRKDYKKILIKLDEKYKKFQQLR